MKVRGRSIPEAVLEEARSILSLGRYDEGVLSVSIAYDICCVVMDSIQEQEKELRRSLAIAESTITDRNATILGLHRQIKELKNEKD